MPSNAILEQKAKVVADLAALIKASASGVIVNYQGITVEKDTAMRKALREAGVKYMVVKNTMTGRACEECGYGALKANLNGMTAIAISESDPIAPARILKEYDEKIESFQILAGYVDGADCQVLGQHPVPALQVRLRCQGCCREAGGSRRGDRSRRRGCCRGVRYAVA